ncbi:SDR family oxidoreductase [Alphaproteobacteria bacterium]|nr:SDR family oxidoreductase [Alphaproteobacteria bacterium]
MIIKLDNKVALVTGGAKGLGKSIVEKLHMSGAVVCFTSRDENEIFKVKSLDKKNIYPIHADVTKTNDINNVFEFINNKFGKIDILVNNVGHTLEITDPYTSKDDWQNVMNLNFLCHVEVTNKFLPLMKKNDWGRIINITSIAGLEISGPAPFNAAKAALTSYTRSVGRLLAYENKNIVMTAVAPGVVITEGGHWEKVLKENPEHAKKYLDERMPLKRFGEIHEVTDIVVFLSSDNASFFHGSIIQVDGGQSRHYMYYSYL